MQILDEIDNQEVNIEQPEPQTVDTNRQFFSTEAQQPQELMAKSSSNTPSQQLLVKSSSNTSSQQIPAGYTRFFKIIYYKQYFKINEQQVKERIKLSFFPFTQHFLELIIPNPDFYGPLWILTTIVCLLGSIGNFSNYFLSKVSSNQIFNKYFFRLEFVRWALVLVYSFGIGIPASLHFALKFMKCHVQLPTLVCLYGYSMSCYIPAILVCILPINLLQWIILLYSFANSTIFLLNNLSKQTNQIRSNKVVIFGIIGGAQLILFLTFKLVFLSLNT